MPETNNELASYLNDALGAHVQSSVIAFGELTLLVKRESLLEVLKFLRDDPRTLFSC